MGKQKPKPSLLPGRFVRQHMTACKIKTGRCGLCRWATFREKWIAELKSAWPHVCLKGHVARIGCSVCALAEVGGSWANFEQKPLSLRLHHFKRHEASGAHVQAVGMQGSVNNARLAPCVDVFETALKRMRAGGSCRDGGSCSDKKHQIRWCLSEAAMEVGRSILKDARCIALTRDERKGKLLVRWRACREDLTSSSGVLGFLPVEGFADDLADRVKEIAQAFCRPQLGLPRGFVQRQCPGVCSDVEKNLRNKTKILITDAAPSELLASSLTAGRRPFARTGAKDQYLRSIKVIGRDAPHATTRLLKRPFAASPELQTLMTEFISGSDSVGQKIFHSPLYKAWWEELVASDSGGPASICAAKHRFTSFLLPLSRLTDNLSAMVKLCQKISLIRGTQGDWASKVLDTFSGRKALLLAMATDAAATCSEFTRSLDNEEADVSQLNSRCQQFALSVQALFISEKIWTLPTYTKAAVDKLDGSPLCILHHGSAREIRISRQDRQYAIKVMKAGMS